MASNSIVFKTYDIRETIEEFSRHFRAEIKPGYPDFYIQLTAAHGEGFVRGDNYQNGLSTLLFNCKPNSSLTLSYQSNESPPLMFIFATENLLSHTIKNSLQYQLSEHMCTTIAATVGCEQTLMIPGGEKTGFYVIFMDRKQYLDKISRTLELLPDELVSVLKDKQASKLFFRENHYNLVMAQILKDIAHHPYSGLSARMFAESQMLELLSMQIRQLTEELNPQNNQGANLRKRDVELLVQARNKLLENLADPPTIKELAQITGTNENKLKAGFRMLYNTSINKLLQDARLNKARQLMAEENYPIKEVAKMVGYAHPAHFASKFRKRFGVLPNEYLKSLLE